MTKDQQVEREQIFACINRITHPGLVPRVMRYRLKRLARQDADAGLIDFYTAYRNYCEKYKVWEQIQKIKDAATNR